MARMVIFNQAHKSEGELSVPFDRGWMLTGHTDVVGGGDSRVSLTGPDAAKAFLNFGRMVLVSHPRLPNWAGMIDVPWNAAVPAEMTVYNAEYLMSLRMPDIPELLTGSVSSIVAQIVDRMNAQGDLFVRTGKTDLADPTVREYTLDDSRNFWDQIQDLIHSSDCEMLTRAELDTQGRLTIYLDIAQRLGVDTGFLYSDGRNGNASFSDLIIDGPIVNRVIGINDASSEESRLRTAPMVNQSSIDKYDVRSQVVQFRGVTEQSTLELYTYNYLSFYAFPRFSFFLEVRDYGEAFVNARLGNTILAHISSTHAPQSLQGFRGKARILAMAYSEAQNILGLKVGLL